MTSTTLPRAARVALIALSLSVAQCGSGSPPQVAPEPSATTGAEPIAAATPSSPWDGLDDAALVERVRSMAAERAREADASLDLAQRAAWGAEPGSAPALGDRVCEQLLNLAVADLAAGELDLAERTVRLVRARARNRNNAFAGNTLLSVIARRRAADGQGASAVAAIFRELPRARFGAATVLFQLYQEPAQVSASLEQIHAQLVTLDTAVGALFAGHVLSDVVANRAVYLEAIDAVRAENDARPADREHTFSTVDLAGARDAQPVLVAVWDTGTATGLFGADRPLGDRLFTNPGEQPNGQDDDGNGLVDDVHGVVADPDPAQTAYTFEPGAEVIAQYGPFLRGVMDLRAGLASTEAAQRVLALMRSATDRESLETLEANLDAIGEWAHGTHVAGILVAGLPQARVAIFRSAWAGETRVYRHRGPTDAELAAERANVEAIAAFIQAHHVRVVNASLGFEQDYVEGELAHQSDVYATPEAVRARAREIHSQRRAEWQWIFEHCPDTLFVIAAGNSNHDVVEYEDVASSIAAPNVLVVGAVDRYGNWATFTNSSPDRVRLFDFGVEVDSVVPTGEHVPLSGTSMASPNAANLAAKMISLDPALTPPRVIELMLSTGEPIAAPFTGVIAHEERALARVRRERRRAPRTR
jgi:subtilisin family serine protease